MNSKSRLKQKNRVLLTVLSAFMVLGTVVKSSSAQGACTDDDNTIRMNYSLYAEDFNNGSYHTALPYLRWILRCKPGYGTAGDRNFRRAVTTYEEIGLASDDSAVTRTYLDSALYIFDIVVPTLQDIGRDVDEYKWLFDKARFIQNHADLLEDIQSDVGPLYLEAFELDQSRLQWYYLNYIITDFVQKDMKSDAVEFMDRVEDYRSEDVEIVSGLDAWRGNLFTSPEERMTFVEGQLEKDPSNLDLIHELFELYQSEGLRDKVYELSPRLMQLEPTSRTYRQIAKMRLDDGDTVEAISLFQQSLDMEGGEEAAKEVHYNIGIAHQQEGRLSRARTSYRRALREDSNYGQVIIAIGDLYVSSVQECGSFEREDKAVYWLAADYFERAAARDQTVRPQARQRLTSIRQYYPTAEEKFFKNWTTGDAYTINYGCYTWVNESTRVR